MTDLTARQKEIVDFIDEFADKNGVSPSLEDIAGYFNIRVETAATHLRALKRKNQFGARRSSVWNSVLKKVSGERRVTHMSFGLSIPLLGRINAGVPSDSPMMTDECFFVSGALAELAAEKTLFALRVTGESMRDLGILDGDIVIVQADAVIKAGDVVVALVDNETTVKSYYPQGSGKIELRPANKDFKVQVYAADAVTVQGKVIALQREF